MPASLIYQAPCGRLIISAAAGSLVRLLPYDPENEPEENFSGSGNALLQETAEKLDAYFAGKRPDFSALPLAPAGTGFQQRVWQILLQIGYGETMTYGEIAEIMAKENRGKMSAQAVGGAVGRNPVCIIIPCHRVLAANGFLGGFGAGLKMKKLLLDVEKISYKENRRGFFNRKNITEPK